MAGENLIGATSLGLFRYFTRHKTAANLLLVLMLAAGLVAVPRMHAQFFPDVVIDNVVVTVPWTGAGSSDVDSAIVQVLEPALMAVDGVSSTASSAAEGRATITLEFDPGWDIDRAAQDVQDAIENGLRDAPQGAGRFPVISGMKFEADLKQPQGSRVIVVTVDDKPIDPAGRYTVASNNFLLDGGDGYVALGRGKTLIGLTDGKLMANEVMVYVRRLGTVDAKIEGRAVLK